MPIESSVIAVRGYRFDYATFLKVQNTSKWIDNDKLHYYTDDFHRSYFVIGVKLDEFNLFSSSKFLDVEAEVGYSDNEIAELIEELTGIYVKPSDIATQVFVYKY